MERSLVVKACLRQASTTAMCCFDGLYENCDSFAVVNARPGLVIIE